MYGGIDQLVDTYKGNPQPLAQKVQKAQQSQPPGEVPPDLEEALALQEIAELRQGAQNQQAMQAGGAQQSVVDKLKQMLGGMQQQAQMAQAPQQPSQGQPVMAARGGSIDQLMSNLGRHYAGGGIVAFSNGGNLPSSGEFSGFSGPTPEQEAKDEIRAAEQERMKKLAELEQKTAFLKSAGAPQAQAAQAELAALKESMRPKPSPTDPNFRRLPDPRYTGTAATSPDVPLIMSGSSPAANKPSAGGPSVGGPAKPAVEATDPMEVALRKSIMAALAQDPEAIRKKAMEQNAQFMGLDALLKPAQDRITAREAMIKQMQGERTPAWAEALIAAGKPVRGGLGTLLGQMGNAAQATREGYQAQDLKFFDELSKLNAEIDKAKIEGRYKDVAAGQAAVKELISEKRQAEQSGTSLLNTKENARSREQTANIAAQARRDAAAMQAENAKAKRLQDQNQFLANLEVKHATLLNNDKDYQSMIKQKQFIELQINVTQDEAKRAKLADQLQAQQAKMASYAASKIGGGTVNIPPPPPGAVRETVKKS